MSSHRIERDFLGEVQVPFDTLYGGFTARVSESFKISGQTIHPLFIQTLAEVKKAAAETNNELGLLDDKVYEVIIKALDEVLEGKHSEMFPLDVFQAGAGTPWNMNMNEVVANRANQILGHPIGEYVPVHPNDHVNMSQSSNDVIPNTIRITSLRLVFHLLDSLTQLEVSLGAKAVEFRDIMKSSRTHARDAVPITLGQEFSAYASMVKAHLVNTRNSADPLSSIFLGGTAAGTGVNTHPDYSTLVIKHLSNITELDLRQAKDKIHLTQFMSDFMHLMNALSAFCVDIVKVNNDLVLMSSGPRTGLSEIQLPPVEPGSSIMPGKVNPSIIEAVNMVCFQVQGNRLVVENAAQSGLFDLNVYTPVIAFNLFNSLEWLTNAISALDLRCIQGIEANREVLERYYTDSNAMVTLLSPLIGYEKASELARTSLETVINAGELAITHGYITQDDLDAILSTPTGPNLHIIKKIKEKGE